MAQALKTRYDTPDIVRLKIRLFVPARIEDF
jgi:hypothetical protein